LTALIDIPANLADRLAEHAKQPSVWDDPEFDRGERKLVPAAVLVPLIRMGEQWHLVYTLRSNLLHDHSGQVSFPGGSWENHDPDLIATALRESREEIGLDPAKVRVLGCMAKMEMVTHFKVTPVVGVVDWPTVLTVNPDEVARVFSIPLDWLASKENHDFQVHTHRSKDFNVPYFKPYDGETVWGATAMITLELIRIFTAWE
jgi:8-oxo-dGTP pyrophosphatase MutT (NUDIX family)